jgi:hypothetical protein
MHSPERTRQRAADGQSASTLQNGAQPGPEVRTYGCRSLHRSPPVHTEDPALHGLVQNPIAGWLSSGTQTAPKPMHAAGSAELPGMGRHAFVHSPRAARVGSQRSPEHVEASTQVRPAALGRDWGGTSPQCGPSGQVHRLPLHSH